MKKNFLFLLMMLAPVFAWAAELTNDNVRIQSFTYQGDDTQSKIVVEYYDGSAWNALTKDVDYTIQFFNSDDVNVATVRNQGDYYAQVTGIGAYSGSTDKTKFTVKKAGLTVNLLNAFRDYGQAENETEVIIQINGYKAGDDEDTAPVIMTVKSAACNAAGGVKGQYTIDDATGVADNYDVGVDIQSTAKLTIRAKNIEDIWVVSNDASVEYNGNAQEPAVVVKDKFTDEVIDPANYDVVYNGGTDAINVGTDYAITVTAKGNYEGDVDSKFNIDHLTLTAEDIVIGDIDAVTYNAEAWTPEATVTGKGFTLTKGTDFTWEYANNVNASEEAQAIVNILTTSPNFTFTGAELKVTKNFTINPLAIATDKGGFATGFAMANSSLLPYTGNPVVTDKVLTWTHGDPAVTVNLVEGTDYTIDYKNGDIVGIVEAGVHKIDIKGMGNFTGTVTGKKTLRIATRDIASAEVTITFDPGTYPYVGAAQTPDFTVVDAISGSPVTLTVKEGEDDTEYDFVIKEWKNNKEVGTASVVIEGNGNYEGTKEQTFTITKGLLKVQPMAGQSKNVGTVNPEKYEWAWVEGFEPKGEDAATAKDDFFTGAQPVVTRIDMTEGAGDYELNVSVTGVSHANYDVEAVNDPKVFFTIYKAPVTITVKDAAKEYGYTYPVLTDKDAFEFEAVGLLTAESITALEYALYDEEGNEITTLVSGDAVPFGTYTVKAKNAVASSDSYTFAYEDGTLTVGKKAVTIAINNATKTYGQADPEFTFVDPGTLENGETLASLGLTPTLTREAGEVIGTEYAINGSLESDNYTFTFTPGVFTITPGVFNLDRVPKADFADAKKNTAAEYVKNYAGQTVDVQFSMYATEKGVDEQAFKAEKWYSLVLPFDTKVAEVSRAFGYAVVNVLKGMNGDNIRFALHMQDLPANTPFLVKIADETKLADVVGFTSKQIVAPAQVDENGDPYVEEEGVRFIGTYKGKVDGFRSNEWYLSFNEALNEYYKGNDTNTTYLRPLGAYLQAQPGVEVRGVEVQEADGTYTAIEAVEMANNNAESLYTIDGKKVQKAAQKGVYIQNGKKVILK